MCVCAYSLYILYRQALWIHYNNFQRKWTSKTIQQKCIINPYTSLPRPNSLGCANSGIIGYRHAFTRHSFLPCWPHTDERTDRPPDRAIRLDRPAERVVDLISRNGLIWCEDACRADSCFRSCLVVLCVSLCLCVTVCVCFVQLVGPSLCLSLFFVCLVAIYVRDL